MIVQSHIDPLAYRVRKEEKGQAYILLRDNVSEKISEEDDTLYEYEEYELVISSRASLNKYIEDNFGILFDTAKEWHRQNEREKIKQELEQIDKEYHTDRAVREFILNNSDKFSSGGYERAKKAEEKAEKLRSKL